MAVTMVTGKRTTDLVSSSLIKRAVYEAIYNFKPYQTPVEQFFLAAKNAKQAVGNPKFEIQEDVLVPHRATLASVAASGTSQAVTPATGEAYYFKVGDVLRIHNTNENCVVDVATANGTTFYIKALNNSTALTAATNTLVTRIGHAIGEGTTSPVALSTQGTFPYNYSQIFKQSVNLSGTQRATENYGGDDWTRQRVKATEEFKLDLERAWVFGIRNILSTSGAVVRYTGGMTDGTSGAMGITDTSQYVGNDFASEDFFFNTYLKNLFAKGTNRKKLYCGSDSVIGISNFAKVKQITRVTEKEYGVDVQSVITPFGMVDIVWHPLLEGSYSNWVIGVDQEDYMKYRFLSANGVNRDMQYLQNVQTPDSDERKDYYLAEIGFHLAGGSQGVHRILYPGA